MHVHPMHIGMFSGICHWVYPFSGVISHETCPDWSSDEEWLSIHPLKWKVSQIYKRQLGAPLLWQHYWSQEVLKANLYCYFWCSCEIPTKWSCQMYCSKDRKIIVLPLIRALFQPHLIYVLLHNDSRDPSESNCVLSTLRDCGDWRDI